MELASFDREGDSVYLFAAIGLAFAAPRVAVALYIGVALICLISDRRFEAKNRDHWERDFRVGRRLLTNQK